MVLWTSREAIRCPANQLLADVTEKFSGSEPLMFYPVFLNLAGKRIVIIGGGSVSERRVLSLLRCGALVTVVSPEVTPRLQSLADSNAIVLHRRSYLCGDCAGAFLIFCATNDPAVQTAVWKEAHRSGTLVNTADEPDRCDFIMPAVVEQGDLTIAISTNGKSPALAAHLRRRFSRLIGPEYGELLRRMVEIRAEIRQRVSDFEHRKELHYRIIASGVLRLLRRGQRADAERLIRRTAEHYIHEKRLTGD